VMNIAVLTSWTAAAGLLRKPSDDPSIAAMSLHRSEAPGSATSGHSAA
jgi:hypothetical protein